MTTTPIQTTAGFTKEDHAAFFVRFAPEAQPPKAHIVYLPPFTEEMNRCRAIVANQARWFARQGFSCALLDFYGTGESPGELVDASLPTWHNNITTLCEQLTSQHPAPVYLWGCRLGALIAMDYLVNNPGHSDTLLLWQPIVSGKTYVTQVYRQRLAALMERGGVAETAAQIREQLAEGGTVEVGGYTLGGELMLALDELDMANLAAPPAQHIYWLEHNTEGTDSMNPRSAKALAHLQSLGVTVETRTFAGQPLWQLHKRDNCDSLLEQTRGLAL